MDGTSAISVRTLGAFELCFHDRPVERWKAGKSRSLLQFLLLRPGRIVPRGVLYEALWPDAPWSKNSSSLKVAAHMLRNVLEESRREWGVEPGLRLLTRESGYLLEADGVVVDFEDFVRLADRAHVAQLRGDRAEAAGLYRQAVGLYQGDYLPDVGYDWAGVEREWLRSRLLCALAFLVETDIASGDHVGVIRWCRRVLDAEPLHEETYRALILVHAHLGQLNQAQRWYRLCAGLLRDRLQTGPDLATQRLYARAVSGEFTGRRMDPRSWQHPGAVGSAAPLRTPA
ncbi:AfsR/SARP family transcriptional regulator [Micromonospora sp. KLBMP9576]|uniref:AfsR/SARP family transcriptional regulator n=1 Tax=Micromonospora sp. KLBMP9576 TaxID=3424769 RepID=UPI003D8D85FB